MTNKRLSLALSIALVSTAPALSAGDDAAGPITLDSPGWELLGDAAIRPVDGAATLTAATGRAAYHDVEFTDGTIEFDLEVTEHRSFVFVSFRVQERGEHEEVYFRPHKSALPDAIQYTPAYGGFGQWQLYHDMYSTAAAPLPAGEAIHIKIVVEGGFGTVFVDDMEEPKLRFLLARAEAAGHVALSSFRPAGIPEDVPLARFTNVSIRPGDVDLSPVLVMEAFRPPPGRITSWLLSRAFAAPEGTIRALPLAVVDDTDPWLPAPVTLRGGFVEIERHVTRPEGARRAAVLARVKIIAEAATERRLDLGFSDEASVFLNGRLIASANDDYSFNGPRRQGLLNLDQLAVYLPLEKGENDLTVAVADRFGGWGLAGRFEDVDGLTIEPR